MPSAYFLTVRAVVNHEDPVGLIAMECPEDEYDPEVEDLIKGRDPVTLPRVSRLVARWTRGILVMRHPVAPRTS